MRERTNSPAKQTTVCCALRDGSPGGTGPPLANPRQPCMLCSPLSSPSSSPPPGHFDLAAATKPLVLHQTRVGSTRGLCWKQLFFHAIPLMSQNEGCLCGRVARHQRSGETLYNPYALSYCTPHYSEPCKQMLLLSSSTTSSNALGGLPASQLLHQSRAAWRPPS